MAFVKLDCAVLHSSLWPDKDARDVFITALLMASPHEILSPTKQIRCTSLDQTGWEIPPGWYGFVAAAGVGIINMASIDKDRGLLALERLCSPESESRNPAFEGRRMARIDGGYLVLNYISYRDRDHGAAQRMKRFRERNKLRRNGDDAAQQSVTKTRCVTHSREQRADSREHTKEIPLSACADAPTSKPPKPKPEYPEGLKDFWKAYPTPGRERSSQEKCFREWKAQKLDNESKTVCDALEQWKRCQTWTKDRGQFVPGAHLFLKDRKFDNPPTEGDSNGFRALPVARAIREDN